VVQELQIGGNQRATLCCHRAGVLRKTAGVDWAVKAEKTHGHNVLERSRPSGSIPRVRRASRKENASKQEIGASGFDSIGLGGVFGGVYLRTSESGR